MKTYGIGEVEAVLGVKAHVIRYWETVMPGIGPQKDDSGKRRYTLRDVERLSRLKHLIQDKIYTIEGARDALIAGEASLSEDPSGAAFTLLRQVRELRAGMMDLYHGLTEETSPDTEETFPETEGASPDTEVSPLDMEGVFPDTEVSSLDTEGLFPDIEVSSPAPEWSSLDTEESSPDTEGLFPDTEVSSPDTEGPSLDWQDD
ncbi:MAG: MerR family transcriptional regulator [Spirochaetaceae bacterium]|jgi:DNA-binding transcriptional MerR regulator|nr:MerR family transcriptional regulator [Spirochaetaceae bacterium]